MFQRLHRHCHSVQLYLCHDSQKVASIRSAFQVGLKQPNGPASVCADLACVPSLAISVKMSILLFAPGFAFLFVASLGLVPACLYGIQILGLQVSF
jgi:hypothetical protein